MAEKTKKSKKLIIILAIVVLLIGGGSAFLFLSHIISEHQIFGLFKHLFGQKTNNNTVNSSSILNNPNIYAKKFKTLITNLSSSDGNDHYVEIAITLLISGKPETNSNIIELQNDKAKNAIISILSNKTVDELLTTDGKDNLKSELKAAFEKIFDKKIIHVYFTTFIVQ